MTNDEAIKILRRLQDPELWEPQINKVGYKALDLAISALSRDRWISVEERLPERYKTVLTAAKGDRVRENSLISADRNEWSYDTRGVTHWMPLPEPPKEET